MFVGQNGNGARRDLSYTGKYTHVRDAFKKGIATAKSTYYCGEIESSANDARKMFRVAGDLMGCSRLPLAPNGDDSPADLAERFSAHYVAKITQLHFLE